MTKHKNPNNVPEPAVWELIEKLAGDKLPKVRDLADQLMQEGKQPGRAYADALEQLKLVKNKPVDEDDLDEAEVTDDAD